ncbi:MAG TPA: 4Fe-4S binding protein [Syntrophales bacterium]|nr:4Fe-4S binding protein [Syntrophales bacterium]HOL58601.1 4Fe-4S binding protein [Syntrophales bacterium]HPO34791.1 4Fe-4S binding protein [Syntrophales bacterium]
MSEKNLYQELAAQVGAPNSPVMPKIFAALINDTEARVLLAASPPATVKELAEKTGLSESEISQMMESLFHRGLIFKSLKGDTMRYYRVKSVPQMHDSTALIPGLSREVLDLWKEYMDKEWSEMGHMIMNIVPGSIMRVVPVNEGIVPESRILPYDDVLKIIEGARTLSVTKCSCRVISGAPCNKPVEVCMQVDRAAEYNIERGTGRPLTKEEAKKILKLCEEEGLVHTVDNRQVVGHVICNCCKDCCLNWAVMKGPKKWVAPSRFTARVDADTCVGCGTCAERCFFDAIVIEDTATVVEEKCMGCGVCTVTCPTESIRLFEVRPGDFVPA